MFGTDDVNEPASVSTLQCPERRDAADTPEASEILEQAFACVC